MPLRKHPKDQKLPSYTLAGPPYDILTSLSPSSHKPPPKKSSTFNLLNFFKKGKEGGRDGNSKGLRPSNTLPLDMKVNYRSATLSSSSSLSIRSLLRREEESPPIDSTADSKQRVAVNHPYRPPIPTFVPLQSYSSSSSRSSSNTGGPSAGNGEGHRQNKVDVEKEWKDYALRMGSRPARECLLGAELINNTIPMDGYTLKLPVNESWLSLRHTAPLRRNISDSYRPRQVVPTMQRSASVLCKTVLHPTRRISRGIADIGHIINRPRPIKRKRKDRVSGFHYVDPDTSSSSDEKDARTSYARRYVRPSNPIARRPRYLQTHGPKYHVQPDEPSDDGSEGSSDQSDDSLSYPPSPPDSVYLSELKQSRKPHHLTLQDTKFDFSDTMLDWSAATESWSAVDVSSP